MTELALDGSVAVVYLECDGVYLGDCASDTDSISTSIRAAQGVFEALCRSTSGDAVQLMQERQRFWRRHSRPRWELTRLASGLDHGLLAFLGSWATDSLIWTTLEPATIANLPRKPDLEQVREAVLAKHIPWWMSYGWKEHYLTVWSKHWTPAELADAVRRGTELAVRVDSQPFVSHARRMLVDGPALPEARLLE